MQVTSYCENILTRHCTFSDGVENETPLVRTICSVAIGVLALSAPAFAQQKTEKACQEEWQAHKAANQAKGITEKAYIEKCRTGAAMAPAAPAAATMAAGANQYKSAALAKVHCPAGTVVWANLDSKIFHFSGHKDYGNTKDGTFMCEKDATSQGMRATENEKRP
ncbi:MAG TPA: hypothetical protein VHT68_14110 [Pseudolabrys sp.]|jgi:hypothetical protein|nr:hypothetical protein [Pseudolabrys sp.]